MYKFLFFLWLAAAAALVIENVVMMLQWYTFVWITPARILVLVALGVWFMMWMWFHGWFMSRKTEDDFSGDDYYY